MIEFKTNKPEIKFLTTGKVEISFTCEKTVLKQIESLKDTDLTCTIKEYRQKRSLSQNAYMWVLLDKIATILNNTKEEIYR